MGALWSESEPASVFIQCFHNIKAGQNSWVIRSSCSQSWQQFWDGDTHADFFTVRKTEESNYSNVWQQCLHHKYIWKTFGGKDCHVWGDEWCEETSFFLLIMWQHVVDERRWRFHVICHLSGGLCSLASWNLIFSLHVNASMQCLSCGDRTHTVEDALAIKVLNILVLKHNLRRLTYVRVLWTYKPFLS
jgi:hypothetical protein